MGNTEDTPAAESTPADENKTDASQPSDENKTNEKAPQAPNQNAKGGSFNPGDIIAKGTASKKELPKVEQLGEINVATLNKYNCDHPDRRLLSLFGTVFDVTEKIEKYGPEGSYKEFTGHDITLALGSGKLDSKWLDKFVQMTEKQIESAQGWVEFYETQYPTAGTLKNWTEDQSKWPELTEEQQQELNAECIVM